MKTRGLLAAVLTAGMAIASAGIATAHSPGVADGHVAANTNYGIAPVGHSPLEGVQDGRYTDVWAHNGFAYVGSFQDPDCSKDGVYIADISNPADPQYVGQIESHPNTRVNDVRVHTVGKRDVLIFSHELCGRIVSTSQASLTGRDNGKPDNGGSIQQGQNGISLYDVTNPLNPQPLAKGFLDTEVHNTFPWTDGSKSYLLVVDDLEIDDVIVVEITNPKKPKVIARTGIGTWLAEGEFDLETSELFLGSFATPLLHDTWVEQNPETGSWEAVLSYWDAGFITINLDDPTNPTFIDDSDYPAIDPILTPLGLRDGPEGNAHAAVFGGDSNEFIFGGDEDFDVLSTAVTVGGVDYAATTGSDTPALDTTGVTGTPVYVGLACSAIPDAPSTDGYIAVAVRGACAFTTKAGAAEDAGYDGVVVFNQDAEGRCEASVSMLVEGGIPAVFVPRSAGFAILGAAYDGSACGDGSTDAQLPVEGSSGTAGDATLSALYDGWGYMWVLNNSGADIDVPGTLTTKDGTSTVGPMGTAGYYAPEEVADPTKAAGAGDLTMHNIETDVTQRNRSFISWYSAGMRAVEWRPGHFHNNTNGEGSYSWNVHEVGRWIAGADDLFVIGAATNAGLEPVDLEGSNFWGVTQTEIDGKNYILGSDRNTGLWIFEYVCDGDPDGSSPLYCGPANEAP